MASVTRIVALSFVLSVLGGTLAAGEADATTPVRPKASHAPYCGVYSVFGALRVLGRDVDFEALLSPRYIGSNQGSSVEELKHAAEDQGAYATILAGLSCATLEGTQWPMVLHVSGDGQLREYSHWVLFLGMEDGQARIVDAPDPVRLVPLANLLASWDGTALFISDRPLSERGLGAPDRWMLMSYLALTAAIVIVGRGLMQIRVMRGRPARSARSARFRVLREAVSVSAIAVGLGVGFHSTSPVGFLRNPPATRYVAAANMESFFPKLSVDEARDLVRGGDVVVVDARYPGDYEGGHLPGAINVPIKSTAGARAGILAGVPKDRPILVYCQSKNCQFDETMALRLAREGFEDIRIFVGGWREWEKSGGSR